MARAKSTKKSSTAAKSVSRGKATARAGKARKKNVDELDGNHQHEPGSTSLVIVESPAKAKTIGKYLGRSYRVRATIGHVRDLPEKKMGIDIENGFQPEYVTIPGKEKTVAELKSAARDSREIFLATDPDREGEAIAWHVAQQIKSKNGAPVRRVLFHEITRDAVQSAIENAGEIDERKVDAQQARRVLDRLVGYKASPVLWKTVKKGISAGRVQTVALRLLVEREREIRAFKPVEYWTVEALLEENGQQFTAKLHLLDGKKPVINNEKEANAILAALKPRQTFQVTEVKRRERRKNPAAPFTTSTLQQDAAKKLGFGSKRTMRLAQDLYEGMEVGDEGAVGLITYMRTDSTRVAASAAMQARDYIKMMYGQQYLPDGPRLYTDGKTKNAQDAHESIRPTDPTRRPEHIRKYLKEDQYRLYELIWKRMIASQMESARIERTTIDLDSSDGQTALRASGDVTLFDGTPATWRPPSPATMSSAVASSR